MYKEIDELIEVICQDDIFKKYRQSEKDLYDNEVMALLSRHQMLQNDYLRMKKYENYISNDDIKASLQDVKKEMAKHPLIQTYYQNYHELNDLLEEVTQLVFQNISDELSFDQFSL